MALNIIKRTYERMKAMELEFKVLSNSLVIKPKGEIDSESAAFLRRKIDLEFECTAAKNMTFDLTEVDFMDSSGVGLVIGRYKKVAALGGEVRIKGANRTVARIIELSGLGRIVKMI